MCPQQVRYHLKVEQLFARRPSGGLVLTDKQLGITPSMSINTFEIYESLMSIDSRKNVHLI